MLRASAIVVALLGLVPTANLLGARREIPWWPGAVIIWTAYGGLLLAVLWVVANRFPAALDSATSRGASALMRVPRRLFVVGVSAFTTLLACAVALYAYAGRAYTGDEMAMSWHARMLLAGRLSIPRPAHSEFFNTFGVMDSGPRWFSQFPIGGPALHALGFLIHAPWLVNPILLGIASWQLYRFTERAFGEPAARGTTLLFALSPFVLLLGSTMLNHTATLTLTMIALAELAAWDADDATSRARHAIGVGLAVGAIALLRPYDAVLVAAPIGIFQLARLRRSADRLPSLVLQCVVGAVPIALLLWANARTTGRPLLFAYDAAYGPSHGVGFHVDPMGKMHTPVRGLIYTSGYLLRFNRFLFEWPVPVLLIVCAVLATLRRATRWDVLLLGLTGSFLAGYWAYWYPGFLDGPRFLFPVTPVFILYTARLPEAAARLTGARRRVALALIPACLLCAWLIPLGFSSVPSRMKSFHLQKDKFKTDVVAQVRRAGIDNAVVFVPESWHERMTARLRALGFSLFDAERVVNTLDACALQEALDAADATTVADTAALVKQVIARATAVGKAVSLPGYPAETQLARAPGGPDTPRCRAEMESDTHGVMPHAMFLVNQSVDADGRLAGPVIYARDFGPRNALLRDEYGGRRWYLYRPGRSLTDTASFTAVNGER